MDDFQEIQEILASGEDSLVQFKENITNPDSLAAEFVAFSNSLGGKLFLGVNDDGIPTGLSSDDRKRIHHLISNVSSQNVRPAINPLTRIVTIDDKKIIVVDVARGNNKPYQDKNGIFWVKAGADKRKATSREEIQRIYQESGLIPADQAQVYGVTVEQLDLEYFASFYEERYKKPLVKSPIPIDQLLINLKLASGEFLNTAGTLLFSKNPELNLPAFTVKARAFMGNSLASEQYIEDRTIEGKFEDFFHETMAFILRNIRFVPGKFGVNGIGQPEIPEVVLEELMVNALVHRDYYLYAPIKVFIFRDRLEIISPGRLPNSLTVENIKAGNSQLRNSVLASFAFHLLPYSGVGTGVMRALEGYPDITFINDREGNQFKCVLARVVPPGL